MELLDIRSGKILLPHFQSDKQFIIPRSSGYLGVLIDDLLQKEQKNLTESGKESRPQD